MSDDILTPGEKLERSYAALRQRLREVTSERDHLQVSHNALKAEHDDLREQLEDADKALRRAGQEKHKVKRQLADAHVEIGYLDGALETIQALAKECDTKSQTVESVYTFATTALARKGLPEEGNRLP